MDIKEKEPNKNNKLISYLMRFNIFIAMGLEKTGTMALGLFGDVGRVQVFLHLSIIGIFKGLRIRKVMEQAYYIGSKSTVIILFTGLFTGMVLGLQGYYGLRRVGSEGMLGALVALSLIRELGPVIGSLMITGRAGSAMAAELGTMKITEQLDALESMAIDPIHFLVTPRLVASLIVIPLLIAIFIVVGLAGSYLIGVKLLGINPGIYIHEMEKSIVFKDIYHFLIKSEIFAITITLISSYKGYHCGHGAMGVGKAITQSVVYSSVLILIWDYILTSMMM